MTATVLTSRRRTADQVVQGGASVPSVSRAGMTFPMATRKSECLAQIIPLGERHLRKAVKEYTEHYHFERNHQSRASVAPGRSAVAATGPPTNFSSRARRCSSSSRPRAQ